jgi:tetratricopeptide (TPR) repeat protein/predicted amidohydrolase
MAEKNSEKLLEAEQLHREGNHEEALKLIESIPFNKEFPPEESFKYILLEAKLRKSLEQYKNANLLVDKLIEFSVNEENHHMKLDAMDLKAEILWRTGKYKEGLEVVEEALDIITILDQENPEDTENEIKRKKVKIFKNAGILNWYKGELDLARDYHQKCLEINEIIGNKKGIGSSLNNLGLVYISMGEVEQAIEYYQKSLKIMEELENTLQVATLQNNLGNAYSIKGDLNQGLEYFQLCLEIRRELGNKHDMAISLNNIGAVYQMKGNLQEALEYYQQSLQLAEGVGIPNLISLTTNNIGSILSIRGDLPTALNHLQKSLSVSREAENKENIALALLNLGHVYRKGGNYERAKESFGQAREIYEQMENDLYVSISLFDLLCVAVEIEDLNNAQSHLEKIQHINERNENKVVDQRYRIAKALILKASKRAVDKMKAQEILEKTIEEEVINHELTTLAMFHLCELLLFEFKMTEESVVIKKIRTIIHQLEEIAKQQSSHSLLVKVNLLWSKLALLDMDVNQAKICLLEAKILAREKGLHNLERKVIHEESLLSDQQKKWEAIIEKNISRKEVIGALGLEELLQRMVRKSVAVLTEEELKKTREFEIQPKYILLYKDLIDHAQTSERSKSRIGIAQIGLSETGNIVQDFYYEKESGLFSLREDMISTVEENIKTMVETADAKNVDLLVFPELTIDLSHKKILEVLLDLASIHNMWIIPGSYHDLEGKQNFCKVITPDGIFWEQRKQIPAIIHHEGKRIVEGIQTTQQPGKVTIAGTEFGRMVIVICRDFLDMDLRVELKNHEPPVDILINIAFTPVTEDFQAAHFDARRSIYAYCFFANVAEFGNSLIFSPEKSRTELKIPPGKEDLIYQDINLFDLRAERKNWEKVQKKYIQSTR